MPLPRVIQLISSQPRPPACVSVCVRVCVWVSPSLLACLRERVRKREGALAPESALRGDHSCTLPAANWSLSSCPIHLHFLPITEHYLCSQLGMGLNPFWLSWCYSLQISNEDGEGRVREGEKKNKKKKKGGKRWTGRRPRSKTPIKLGHPTTTATFPSWKRSMGE